MPTFIVEHFEPGGHAEDVDIPFSDLDPDIVTQLALSGDQEAIQYLNSDEAAHARNSDGS